MPALFVDPGFFEEVRAVRFYRGIGNWRAVVCLPLCFAIRVAVVVEEYESKRDKTDQRQ